MSCGKSTTHTKRIGCCPLCGELFSGDTANNSHRTRRGKDGKRGCQPPSSVGLIPKPSATADGEVVWSMPPGDKNPWTKEATTTAPQGRVNERSTT